jgi:hypothetical protein
MPSIHNYGVIASVQITKDGETYALRDWCKKLDLPYRTVSMRYARGVRNPDELLFKPEHRKAADGTWVYYSSLADLQKGRAIQTDFALTSILPKDIAERVRNLATELESTPDEVIVTFVEHGLKRLQK